jgi:NAD(P)-dependent dehydrogenase (short-subunit alcohol dehydrogenase family)
MGEHHQRTAIVTGAGKRVGAEIARALIGEGWSVIAHVRGGDDPLPDGAVRAVADLESLDCAQRIFAAAEGLPPVRLLVNNAARFAWDGFGAFNPGEFDSHMAINVRAPLLLIDELARRHAGGESLVVNLLDSKLASPNPDFLSYTVSKQALAGLTELAARALAGKGIRVNAIAPALMLRSPGQSADNFAAMHASNPLGRGVEPADVVEALRYLVSARAVTGEVLTLDGGQRFWALDRDVQFLERS